MRKSISALPALLWAVPAIVAGSAVLADEQLAAVREQLGGPVIACRGTIFWDPESDNGLASAVPIRMAARDDPDAATLALFFDDRDFLPEDVWPCSDGLCAAFNFQRSGATTNVLRVQRGSDRGDGQVAYSLLTIFTIVSATKEKLQAESVTGEGTLLCEGALPDSVTAKQ